MKTTFKRIFSLAVALILIAAMMIPCYAAESQTLYEKFGYDENFKYNGESRAHVLKTAVCKISLEYTGTIQYESVSINEDDMLLDILETAIDLQEQGYSEDDIVSIITKALSECIVDYLASGAVRTVQAQGCWLGSGVVFSEDGYIATNAHVTSVTDYDKFLTIVNEFESDYDSLVSTIENEYGIPLDEATEEYLLDIIIGYAYETASFSNDNFVHTVYFPDEDGYASYEDCVKYPATVVAQGVAVNASEEGDGLVRDAAILKINADNLVALSFSNNEPALGSNLTAGGFPGAANQIFDDLGVGDESFVSISIDTGTVREVKKISGTKYTPIGISVTINHGSSGGPSIDDDLNIEGLNTYSSIEDNRYAYMIPARYVVDLADGNGVDMIVDEATKVFLTGIQMLQEGYGDAAEECFIHVRNLNKHTAYVNELIDLSRDMGGGYPEVANQKNGSVNLGLVFGIIGGVLVIAVIVVVIIIIVNNNNNKKRRRRQAEMNSQNNFGGGFGSFDMNNNMRF